MKYLEWNNAIINHYFNPDNEEKEVILYFSERIIEEIGRKNFEEPEGGYINDFYNALRYGIPGMPEDYIDYIQRLNYLEEKFNSKSRPIEGITFNYPPYLAYFLTFILPFTSGKTIAEFNSNNFYGYLNSFFKAKKLIPDNYKFNSTKLKEIDGFWKKINDWLIEEKNFQFGYLEEIHPPENRKYVGKFAYHILFRKEQEEKLSGIFDKEDLLPNETITEKQIKEILLNHANELSLKQQTKKQIQNEDYFGKLIINRALKYYNNWDGVNYESGKSRGFSRNHLVLSLKYNSITKKIDFLHYRIFTNKNIPESSIITYNNKTINEVRMVNRNYSNPVLLNISLENKIDLIDEANRIKYTFKPRDFYLFKKNHEFGEWIQIPKVEYNAGTILIISKKDFYEHHLKEWFEKIDVDNKTLLQNNEKTGLPENWIAFTVKTLPNYPHPEIQELKINTENEPKIEFDKAYYYDGKFFVEKLPFVWIENAEASDDIYAKYKDGKIIKLDKKFDDQPFYAFTEEHIKRKNKKFKLISEGVVSHRFYEIDDFKKKSNEEIEKLLPLRDATGRILSIDNEDNYLKGIEPFLDRDHIIEYKKSQNFLDGNNIFYGKGVLNWPDEQKEYNIFNAGNILINYLSTKGKLTKEDFDKAVFALLKKEDTQNIQKIANWLRYSLQDAGFIDYDAVNSKIVVNKPHLLIQPSEKGIITFLTGARDNAFVKEIINYSRENNIIVDIQDNHDKLHPQIIYLKFKQPDIKQVKSLANEFGLILKKYNLYTQFVLASFFPDISKWKIFIDRVENELTDFPGGQIFDIETLSFIPKPEDFDKNLSFIKHTNINGYKTVYRLWYNSIAYSIEEQQLGIYIYLYLFKKSKDENFEKCKENKGWSNCGKEQELKELARKKTNVIFYDRDKKYLAVPLNCRLPRNLSISVALLNGQKPKIEKLRLLELPERYYIVYKNVPSLFLRNTINLHLLKKDLNSLHQTTINIEL